jgi:16S rRNA (cytosine967-C5)-methyltransferase
LTDEENIFLKSLNNKLNEEFPENIQLNYPVWMTPLLKRSFPEGLADEMLALNERAQVDLRVNTLKTSKNEVKKILFDSGFQVIDCPLSTNGLRLLNGRLRRSHEVLVNGLVEIQDEGSQLIAEVCAAAPGDTVVDFCAGAGGKTLALAAAMANKGRIFALDKSLERLENAQARLKKARAHNVFCCCITGKWIKRHLECADVVLVDAPCSGTGTWRRNPDMRARFSPNDLCELLSVQEEILESACKLVKSKGRIIYATCSILKEENDDQVKKFLGKHPEFSYGNVGSFPEGLLRLSPFKHFTDGFFAAVLKKC